MNTPRNFAVSMWAVAAACGVFLLVLLELLVVLFQGGELSGAGSAFGVFQALLGLYLPVGLLLGAALGCFWWAASRVLGAPLGSAFWGYLSRLREEPEADARAGAWVFAVACGALLAALFPAAAFFIARSFANPLLAAIFLALFALAGMVGAVFVAPFVFLLAHAPLRLIPAGGKALPRRFTSAVLILLIPSLLGGLFFMLRLEGVNLWPLFFVGFFLLLLVGFLLFFSRRLSSLRARALGLGALFLTLLMAVTTATGLAERREVVAAVSKDTLAAGRLLKLARAATDFDHDGVSALFAGGDCDDNDASVYPGAREIPGNGKDDNCLGGDASPQEAPGAALATSSQSVPAGPTLPRMNFLLITVDTLRADRLGAYGYERPTSPRIDAFAKDAVLFQNAYAQAPHTPRSFPSFLTSKLPRNVAWVKSFANYPAMKDENLTFFEVLQEAGYKTAAIFSHHYFKPERNVAQGIADFSNENPGSIADSNKAIKSPELVPKAQKKLSELKASGEPFALWVHLYEPHSSYLVHEGGPQFGSSLSDKYDGEIAFVDRYIGELFDTLDKEGLSENTVVILFSDHGESFGEHQKIYFHGSTLFEEVLRVPLIMRVPGLSGRVVSTRVSLLDLFPTICELAHVTLPPGLEGRSLLPDLHGVSVSDEERVIVAELLPYPNFNEHHVALLKGRYKLIHRISENIFELYDLVNDPKEQKNLYKIDEAATAEMERALESFNSLSN